MHGHLEQMNPEARSMLPGIAFGSFVRRFQEPTLEEGFQDIYKVDFEVNACTSPKKGKEREAFPDGNHIADLPPRWGWCYSSRERMSRSSSGADTG